MDVTSLPLLRSQLTDRRQRLERAMTISQAPPGIAELLFEVDAALDRMAKGTYGLCETCHDPIEADRLIADPLVRLCLDHLTPTEQRDLEDDLLLASRIQRELLPKRDLRVEGWEIAYQYHPKSVVSGDYCDVILTAEGDFYFMIGDVSGKGVAASMLMAHLHAMLRTLTSLDLTLGQIMERASRVFCESTLPTHYATMVCGRAKPSGSVEICNAGHPPPLLFQRGAARTVDATGLPLGMFCNQRFSVVPMHLERGDTVLLYTDGISETEDGEGRYYGADQLLSVARQSATRATEELVGDCFRDVERFRRGTPAIDDRTLVAIRRA